MSKTKVAIVGASGFVGTALTERLFFEEAFTPVAVLHSAGRSARIARLATEIRRADLLDPKQALQAVSGCDYVVNCSRGDTALMIKGLKNLAEAAQKAGAKGLIHISSAAIFGSAADYLITEKTPPRPEDEYAAVKLRQDDFVLGQKSLRCMVFCPPTIYGPYSAFVLGLIPTIREGRLPLVDGGSGRMNVIHVDNLVQAVLAGIQSDNGWGERYLINEVENKTWSEFFTSMRTILGSGREFLSVSSTQIDSTGVQSKKRSGLADNFKILLSGEFRSALSLFPAFKTVNEYAYQQFSSANPGFQRWIRSRLQRPIVIAKKSMQPPLDKYLLRVQARKVYYSPEKLLESLHYRPVLSYEDQLKSVQHWLEFAQVV